jgi:thiamine pyrophosphate-dependent acetolactate synthase large subunit-like protein
VQLSGADLIVRLLERQGITTLAGVPGGANLPLYDALARRGRLRHVLARHEQGAGFIAQGMARALGTPQVPGGAGAGHEQEHRQQQSVERASGHGTSSDKTEWVATRSR